MLSLFVRAPLLALLPVLISAAAPPAASKPAGAKTVVAPAAPKNASASTQAKAVAPKNTSKPVVNAVPAAATAAIKIASTARTVKAATPIVAGPNTGVVPKPISRHLQEDKTNDVSANLRSARKAVRNASIAHMLVGKAHANATHFLAQASAECECHFTDMCECQTAMAFMTCVAKACASGGCDCRKYEFLDACGSIADVCGDLAISCGHERAECIHEEVAKAPIVVKMPKGPAMTKEEIYEELMGLKEQKCRLEVAKDDGWLNAAGQLEETNYEIKELIDRLATMGEKMPEMHCQKHFEEWSYPPSPVPKQEEIKEEPIEVKPAKEPTGAVKKPVPLWSAPPRSGAGRQASPLLIAAGLVSAMLAAR